jgi:predicted TPR repeat methyltransferase
MGNRASEQIHAVYDSKDAGELEVAYDGWAEKYEADVVGMGYRIPAVAAGLIGRQVPVDAEPLLDAGCGTGLLGHVLRDMGYGNITGLDASNEMLAVAGRKSAYSALCHGRLGNVLDFLDDQFAATSAIGVFSPGHAEPDAFGELIRVTRPDGVIAFSIRHDTDGETGYAAGAEALETRGF